MALVGVCYQLLRWLVRIMRYLRMNSCDTGEKREIAWCLPIKLRLETLIPHGLLRCDAVELCEL